MVRILLVEDDATVREAVAAYLTRAGHDVDPVADGEAAVEHFTARPADLVLLDLMLPGLGGLEVARRLRSMRRDLPLIMKEIGPAWQALAVSVGDERLGEAARQADRLVRLFKDAADFFQREKLKDAADMSQAAAQARYGDQVAVDQRLDCCLPRHDLNRADQHELAGENLPALEALVAQRDVCQRHVEAAGLQPLGQILCRRAADEEIGFAVIGTPGRDQGGQPRRKPAFVADWNHGAKLDGAQLACKAPPRRPREARDVIQARPVEGRFRRRRWRANAALIAILLGIPWIRIGGEPLVLLDVPEREFHVFGLVIVPQELYFLWLLVGQARADWAVLTDPRPDIETALSVSALAYIGWRTMLYGPVEMTFWPSTTWMVEAP